MKGQTKTVLVLGAMVSFFAIALSGTPGASLAEEPTETASPSGTPSATESPTVTPTPTPTPTETPSPTPTTPPPDPRRVTSVTIAVIENHGRVAVAQKMPKITALGKRFGISSNTFAITHPSKPNYLVIASGSLQGEKSNRWAIETAPALFDRVDATDRVVLTYAQGMGTDNCRMSNRGAYVWHHNWQVPFTSGSAKRAQCEKWNRDGWDSRQLWANDLKANRLTRVNMVLPDNDHNWHDSPYSDAAAKRSDDWVAARVAEFIKSPAYAAGGVFIITADEARPSSKVNDVTLIVIHKSLDGKHRVAKSYMNLRTVHRFMSEVAHVQSGAGAWGLFAKEFDLVVA